MGGGGGGDEKDNKQFEKEGQRKRVRRGSYVCMHWHISLTHVFKIRVAYKSRFRQGVGK